MKILPLYIPNEGCRSLCVYCNQSLVVGAAEERSSWSSRLHAIDESEETWEIAFYAGTFSALPQEEMKRCFAEAAPYLKRANVLGLRLSTRPDRLPDDTLAFLKREGIRTIELGVESLDDAVLEKSARGHNAVEARGACERVKRCGFKLGIHLMCGLPGQNFDSWKQTVQEAAALRPDFVRIAPTLVLKKTRLERMFLRGEYQPLSLEEAIEQCAYAHAAFLRRGIDVARIGLALSDDRGDGAEKVAAGPWHPALRHEVESQLAQKTILAVLRREGGAEVVIHPRDVSITTGAERRNLRCWEQELGYPIAIARQEEQARGTFRCGEGASHPLFWEDDDE
ncbi:MAG: radical SAM protein [Candidatus Omnitrophota bacterium]